MSHSHDDIKSHTKTYVNVFLSLMVLTAVTVGVSYAHLAVPAAIIVALIIAAVKGSLVASFFMHLVGEKPFIFGALALTVVFFLVLVFLPLLGLKDQLGQHYQMEGVKAPAMHAAEAEH
jgi:cytochrome c oxidase subunit 4